MFVTRTCNAAISPTFLLVSIIRFRPQLTTIAPIRTTRPHCILATCPWIHRSSQSPSIRCCILGGRKVSTHHRFIRCNMLFERHAALRKPAPVIECRRRVDQPQNLHRTELDRISSLSFPRLEVSPLDEGDFRDGVAQWVRRVAIDVSWESSWVDR